MFLSIPIHMSHEWTAGYFHTVFLLVFLNLTFLPSLSNHPKAIKKIYGYKNFDVSKDALMPYFVLPAIENDLKDDFVGKSWINLNQKRKRCLAKHWGR